jgi:hypothetical protein
MAQSRATRYQQENDPNLAGASGRGPFGIGSPCWKLTTHGDLMIPILGQISHSKNLARSSLEPVIFYRWEKCSTIDMSY